jgi:hypothetical protein
MVAGAPRVSAITISPASFPGPISRRLVLFGSHRRVPSVDPIGGSHRRGQFAFFPQFLFTEGGLLGGRFGVIAGLFKYFNFKHGSNGGYFFI